MIITSTEQVKELRKSMQRSAEDSYNKLRSLMDSTFAMELLFEMKFNKIGYDPVKGIELNLIEQINQLFSDLVAMSALEALLELYPGKEFLTHLGTEAGFDIEAVDGTVVAECFAVTTASSNGKLKKDAQKLISKTNGQKKHIYFYVQNDTSEKLERIYEQFPEITFQRVKKLY